MTSSQPIQAPKPPPGGWLPCPCCGQQMFAEFWSYDICSVCFWEDDLIQLRYPWCGMGPNHGLSLIEAQANYRQYGAVEERLRAHVRPPAPDEPLDPGWRPVDLSRDAFETEMNRSPYPDDLTTLFWWRPTFWRRHEEPAQE